VGGECRVERLLDQIGDVSGGDQLPLAWLLGDQRRGVLRREQARRVGLEGERAGGAPSVATGGGEERLVPEVHAVEVADGGGPAGQLAYRRGESVVDAHRRCFRGVPPARQTVAPS